MGLKKLGSKLKHAVKNAGKALKPILKQALPTLASTFVPGVGTLLAGGDKLLGQVSGALGGGGLSSNIGCALGGCGKKPAITGPFVPLLGPGPLQGPPVAAAGGAGGMLVPLALAALALFALTRKE